MPRQRRDSATQVMQRLDFDPLKHLVKQANALAKTDPNGKELRDICLDLMPYAYAKIKQVEHSVADGSNVTVTIGGQQPNQVKDVSDAHQPITVDAEVQPAAPAMRPT